MQAYPAHWDELLRSKNLLQEPPKVQVQIGEGGGTPELTDPTQWTTRRTITSGGRGYGGVAETSQGQAIVAYAEGDAVKVAFASSIQALVDGSELPDTDNATTIKSGLTFPMCSITNIEDELHLVVSDLGSESEADRHEHWVDENGTGAAFSFRSVIREGTTTEDDSYRGAIPISTILALPNGDWAVSLPRFFAGRGGLQIARTGDEGDNWSNWIGIQPALANRIPFHGVGSMANVTDDSTFSHLVATSARTDTIHGFYDGGSPDGEFKDGIVPRQLAFIRIGDDIWISKHDRSVSPARLRIYRIASTDIDQIIDENNWTEVVSFAIGATAREYALSLTSTHLIHVEQRGDDMIIMATAADTGVMFLDHIKSVTIDRSRGMTSTATIIVDNKDGLYSRDNTESPWFNVILPGARVEIRWGYEDNLLRAFTGKVSPGRHPSRDSRQAELRIDVDDLLKWRGKGVMLTNPGGDQAFQLENTTIEDAFRTIAGWLGWPSEVVHTDATGVLLSAIPFEHEEGYDALKKLGEWVHYDVFTSEFGNLHLKFPANDQPAVSGDVQLAGEDPFELQHHPVIVGSDRVFDATGTVQYVRGEDYEIDYGSATDPASFWRLEGGNIGDGETVTIHYAFSAWLWQEGTNLRNLDYTETLEPAPGRVVRRIEVVSEDADGNEIVGVYTYPNADEYNLPTRSLRRVEVPGPATQSDVDEYAALLGRRMEGTPRGVRFTGEPWTPFLQIGDTIQVIEATSTISELYRIDGFRATMDPSGFRGEVECYFYGFAEADS